MSRDVRFHKHPYNHHLTYLQFTILIKYDYDIHSCTSRLRKLSINKINIDIYIHNFNEYTIFCNVQSTHIRAIYIHPSAMCNLRTPGPNNMIKIHVLLQYAIYAHQGLIT